MKITVKSFFRLIPAIIVFAALPILSSCDTEKDYSTKVCIMSQGAGFTGWYVTDGNTSDIVHFGTSTINSYGYYELTIGLESSSTLQLSVSPLSSSTTSLEVLLYDDTDVLKDVVSTDSDDSGILDTISIYYTFDTTSTSTTTSD